MISANILTIFLALYTYFLPASGSEWRAGRDSRVKVPDSCCKTVSEGCGARDHPSNIPYTGCIHRFAEQLTQHLLLLGLVSLGLALLQVIGVILTSCLFSRYTTGTAGYLAAPF